MIERLLERVDLGVAEYFALDSDPAHPAEATRRLQVWLTSHAGVWDSLGQTRWQMEVGAARVAVHWVTASLFDEALPDGPFDVILAHAFLDLVDLDRALPRLLALRPGGVFHFSLNFDGLTFLPEIDPALDEAIVDVSCNDGRTARWTHPSGTAAPGAGC
jgi:hypothetical protein